MKEFEHGAWIAGVAEASAAVRHLSYDMPDWRDALAEFMRIEFSR